MVRCLEYILWVQGTKVQLPAPTLGRSQRAVAHQPQGFWCCLLASVGTWTHMYTDMQIIKTKFKKRYGLDCWTSLQSRVTSIAWYLLYTTYSKPYHILWYWLWHRTWVQASNSIFQLEIGNRYNTQTRGSWVLGEEIGRKLWTSVAYMEGNHQTWALNWVRSEPWIPHMCESQC